MIEERQYSGFLFDMDGTLLDSTTVIHRVWGRWAQEHGFDAERFIEKIHGIRAEDVISRLNLPDVDVAAEVKKILIAETEDIGGIVPHAGAREFLQSLPQDRWTIVTSAPRELALSRLRCVGIPVPDTMVTAEDVKSGKPNPECYLLGAARLGFAPKDCLVFEDAAAGIAAGEAAGCDVLVVAGASSAIVSSGHPFITNYEQISVRFEGDGRACVTVGSQQL